MELFKLLGKIAIENAEARKALKEVSQEGQETESKLGKTFSAIGKGAVAVGKVVAKGMVAGAVGCKTLAIAAVKSYADYEQLVGGVETLFGTRGAKTVEEYAGLVGKTVKEVDAEFGMLQEAQSQVMQNAANAYKTCGLSANAYMETATSLAAALNQSSASQLDSANLADQAITDMSDNANKMGTSMEAIQNAYNGFSKQNYTMLDNLKLGYGGTKEEMQRLLDDAGKLETAMGRKFDINNFADVTEAIHLMQVEMGISGISYKEYQNLVESGAIALRNITPRITQALTGISSAIAQIAPILQKEVPNLFQESLPAIIEAVVGLFDAVVGALPGIISAIQTILPQLIEGFMQIFTGVVEALIAALPLLIDGVMLLIDGLIGALPQIIQALVDALPELIPQIIDAVVSLIMMLVEMLPQIIDPLIAALPTIIISIVEALVGNLPVLIEGFIQLFMGIVTALPQIIQALVDALPTVISLLVQALLNNLPAIITGLIQCVMGIVTALPQIFGSLISAIPAALSGIWDGIKNVFGGLGDWFGKKFSGAKDAAVNAWNGAKEKWNSIKEKCVEGFSNFKDKVKDKFSDAKKAAEEKWSDAKQKWNSVKDKVVDGFSNLKDKVKDKFSEAKTNAQNAWSDAKDKFSSVKDKVVDAFSNLGSKISPLFTKAKNNATQTWSTVKSAFNKIKNGDIVGAFNDLGSLMKGKFKTALNTAKKAFDKVKDIGLDIVKGIGNGITSGLGWIKARITEFCGNVTSFIKKLFKIKSPSGVMRDEVGRELARGVAVGIEQNTAEATDAMKHLGEEVLAVASATIAEEVAGIQKEAAEKTSEIQADLAKDTAKTQEDLAKKTTEAQEKMADVSKDTAKKVSTANAKLNSEILKTAKAKLDAYKQYNKLTAESESQFWDQIRQQFAEGTEERIEADKLYFDARSSIDKELLDAAKKRLENYQVYNDMTLAEEVGFWDDLRQNFEEGTDARIEADKNYLSAKKNINEKILSAEEKLQDELDDIASRVEDRQKGILDKFGLFDKFDTEDDTFDPATQMLLNMDADIKTMQKYKDMMDGLEERIGGTALFEELKDMGLDARGNILEVSKMTDAELAQFVKLYDEKAALAKSMAEEELAPQMMEDSQKAFDDFVTSCGDMGFEITSTLADYMTTAEGTVLNSLATIAAAFSTFQLGAPGMDVASLFTAPTISNGATVYSLKASAVGSVEAESQKTTTGTMSDVYASIVEQKNMFAKLLEMLGKFFPELIEAFDVDLFVNGRQLAAELAPDIDAELGFLSSKKERGR